jgi:DNA excision repair protein ERCC-3
MEPELKTRYAQSGPRQRFRLAAENPSKTHVLDELVKRHHDDKILVIGQYLNQLDRVSRHLDTPIITGRTPKDERLELYGRFRDGDLRVLVVSKVGNFAVDLPAASVIIQISGTFGSRQEEAQRLGRVLRPKEDGRRAVFYSLVSDETVEQDFGQHRQLFLTEQGYAYEILDAADLKNGKCT